ncbi:hypothetical protein PHYBOEH_010403 [Phytophthora boehmeriae]|uniref:Uncharacterized protein n=1 Tax=Phytophthora boehmeriae TaxID=109152 RepID=A0A8T1VRN0_9STRA|nr:hypothetical protein PHYBOEH_010403 [Phytophthora boehmeriae]
MIGSAIFWEGLDFTPWMRFVPASYFSSAKVILQGELMRGIKHRPWDRVPAEFQEYVNSGPSKEDDTHADPDYDDNGVSPKDDDEDNNSDADHQGGESRSEGSSDDGNSDEDSQVSPPRVDPLAFESSDESDDDLPYNPELGKYYYSGSKGKGHFALQLSSSSKSSSTKSSGLSRKRHAQDQGSLTPIKNLKSSTLVQTPSTKVISPRVGTRTRSPLAGVPLADLTPAELEEVGVPDTEDVKSWHHYGILVKHYSVKTPQIPGFPSFDLQKSQIKEGKARWDLAAYQKILKTKSWDAMFEGRERDLYFPRLTDLDLGVHAWIQGYVNWMSQRRRGVWESLPWITMDPSKDTVYAGLYSSRQERREKIQKGLKALQTRRSKIDGFPKRLDVEPAL